ncbi:MAG TPA: arsenate reductase ArsC [Campylobacterales bacterium]|nr:arsenate reductase ArsC [Campylobacterales bacterium]
MEKNVLILCTGNSCRSIIGEALINTHLEGVTAYSSGVAPSGRVNPLAQKVLEAHGDWDNRYHSKVLDEVMDVAFDLVVTVCDHAQETCPIFPQSIPIMHVGFEDPDGKAYEAFEATYQEIKEQLLPEVQKKLGINTLQKNVFKTQTGVKISFTGAVEKQQIISMVQNCQTGQCECMSDATKQKISDMQVEGKDGEVELKLTGDVKKEEIEAALAKSKVLNKPCC